LSGGAARAAYFLSVSMMADKESSKETAVQSAIKFLFEYAKSVRKG